MVDAVLTSTFAFNTSNSSSGPFNLLVPVPTSAAASIDRLAVGCIIPCAHREREL